MYFFPFGVKFIASLTKSFLPPCLNAVCIFCFTFVNLFEKFKVYNNVIFPTKSTHSRPCVLYVRRGHIAPIKRGRDVHNIYFAEQKEVLLNILRCKNILHSNNYQEHKNLPLLVHSGELRTWWVGKEHAWEKRKNESIILRTNGDKIVNEVALYL